jgi:hypothetical protein
MARNERGVGKVGMNAWGVAAILFDWPPHHTVLRATSSSHTLNIAVVTPSQLGERYVL